MLIQGSRTSNKSFILCETNSIQKKNYKNGETSIQKKKNFKARALLSSQFSVKMVIWIENEGLTR